MTRKSDSVAASFTAADLAYGMAGAAAAPNRVAEGRRAVLLVAAMAASLLICVAAGVHFLWKVDAWLLTHGILECLILIVTGHLVSVSAGIWIVEKDPRWLVVGAGFLLTAAFNVGHILIYTDIVETAPGTLSTAVFLWAHESTACVALLAAAWAMSERRISYTHGLLVIAAMGLFVAGLLVFAHEVQHLVRLAWMEKGNNFFNILVLMIAVLFVGWRVAGGDRTPGLIVIGAAIGVEMVAQFSYLLTRQVLDSYTTLGHVYKLAAFALLYYGLVLFNILRPLELARQTEALFRTLVERLPAGIVLSRAGRILHANRAFLALFGFPSEESARQTRIWALDADDPEESRRRHTAREAGQIVPLSGVRRALRHDGKIVHVRTDDQVVNLPDGRATLGYFVDLSETVSAQEQLQKLANFDPLTGLPNRSLLLDRLEQATRVAQRGGDLVAVLFIDLDEFKQVNDTLGHAAGDELLRMVAGRLRKSCREEDTLGRLGGDEFLVIMQRLPSHNAAAVLADKLVGELEQPFEFQGREIYIGGSIGISLFPRDAQDVDTMIKHADVAMYQAKRNRHLHVYFYSEEMNARALERLELGSEVRRAVEREEFELHYQPKVEVANGRVAGVEGLLRWRSPTRGLVPPAAFIPILEESGLISTVGRRVLARACKQANEWSGMGFGRIQVAVNVSPAQLKNEALLQDVQMALEASGLPAGDLQLEITESLLLEDFDQARKLLEKLTERGLSIALDDFGTGYSSLGSLHHLPVNCVKIDRSFVHALDNSKSTIVAAIINVAHTLGMKVIAEGVETETQRAMLESLGCEEMQGYLVAPPMPIEELLGWLAAHRKPHLVPIAAQKKE
ncbi:MAG: EAL domain-containing protein [Prolixibacteraceae bacterium]|nr:EAL domain-containing protein [Burkholderiales bacterium]